MKEERIIIGDKIFYLREYGQVRAHKEGEPTFDCVVNDLVYISMRWQELFGPLPSFLINREDWKGVEGI